MKLMGIIQNEKLIKKELLGEKIICTHIPSKLLKKKYIFPFNFSCC